jgi:hypothetical protein
MIIREVLRPGDALSEGTPRTSPRGHKRTSNVIEPDIISHFLGCIAPAAQLQLGDLDR